MTRAEVLAELLALGGVKGAAFVDSSGELLETPPGEVQLAAVQFSEVQEALSGCLASSRSLAEILGAEATQTVLEFGGGDALLIRLTAPPEASLNVVVLTTAVELGRVRFGLRRLLPQLTG